MDSVRSLGARRSLAAASMSLVLASSAFAGAGGTVVYANNFEAPPPEGGSGFSSSVWSQTPTSRGFLGEFGNETVRLPLSDLPQHDTISIAFDLYLIRSWDGNQPLVGPDMWGCGVSGGQTLLNSSFAVQPVGWERTQSFPSAVGMGDFPMATGAVEFRTLGYTWAGQGNDAVYRFEFTFPHAGSSIEFWFAAQGLQAMSDESWGIDNVSVTTIPTPGALALLGVAGCVAGRRRRK